MAVADVLQWLRFPRQKNDCSNSASPTVGFFFWQSEVTILNIMGLGLVLSVLLYLGYSISSGPDNQKLLMAAALHIDMKDRAQRCLGA